MNVPRRGQWLLCIPALLVGCSSEFPEGQLGVDPTDLPIESIKTLASPSHVIAGDAIRVLCLATHVGGATSAASHADIVTVPDTGLVRAEKGFIAEKAGEYVLTCQTPGVVGSSGRIQVVAGDPMHGIVRLDKNRVIAGETVGADCLVEDPFGNEVTSADWHIGSSPARGSTVENDRITPWLAGNHEISCIVEGHHVNHTDATLLVDPGPPVAIIAYAPFPRAEAGQHADVECFMVDAFTNHVDLPTEMSVSPNPTSIDNAGFVAENAGDYLVTCSHSVASLTSDPTLVRVLSGLPATVEITGILPNKPIYALGDVLSTQLDIRDVFGNQVPRAEVLISSTPQHALRDLTNGKARVEGSNGTVTLTVIVAPPTYQNQTVTDSTEITVDSDPPEVVFTFPQRAEIVTGNQGGSINITGTVTDAVSGVVAFSVNGNPVTVGSNGSFQASMSPDWAINLIEVEALDGAGNLKSIAQSFEYAEAYKRASPSRQTSGRIPDGLMAHLSQQAIDDNNNDVDDIATIARLAIMNMDINSLMPSPATTYNSDCSIPFVTIRGSLRMYVDDVRFGNPNIDITTRTGGLHLSVTVPSVVVDMHTSGDVCDIGVNVSGSATASSITISGNLNISRSGSSIVVSMPSPSVNINNLHINLSLPSIIDWAVDGIINLFRGTISNALEDAFSDTIRQEIPPVIEDFLESVEIDESFALPAPLSVSLNIGSAFGTINFNSGGGTLGLNTTIYAQGAMTPEPLGGILQYQRTPPSFNTSRALGVAISYDLVNQALYSLWYGGGLDFDLTAEGYVPDQFDLAGSTVELQTDARALLPPVVVPTGDATYPLELQVGDLELNLHVANLLNLPPSDIKAYAHIKVRASASVNSSREIVLAMAPNAEITMEVDAPSHIRLIAEPIFVALEIALTSLMPFIFGEVMESIPIPDFDLSSMAGSYLPPGIVLGVGNPQTDFQSSYLVLEGNVAQVQ